MKIYNTLTRKKEDFVPLKAKSASFYACGPTVYNFAQIGNLRSYLTWDLLKRVLVLNKFKVKHVMNITDVGHLTDDADAGEDKMEKGSRREGKSVWDIARFYTVAFQKDLKELNIVEPSVWCKATDHIKEQIDMIKKLEKKGFTYKTSDGIYFDTAKLKDYGKLAQLKVEGLEAGKRVDLGEKKNITDFALWKFSKESEKRQMEWKSPWGVGFPGWHIECSAMAIKYLGKHFDIHCGGIDHIPVHHTNEIAQSEPLVGSPWVKYWMHNEFVLVDGGKMAKSLGNFYTVNDLKAKGFDPLAYRYFVLNTHYRTPLNFTFDALAASQQSLSNIRERMTELLFEKSSKKNPTVEKKFVSDFIEAVSDDLNTPKGLAILREVFASNEIGAKEKLKLAYEFDRVFGLNFKNIKITPLSAAQKKLIAQREAARKNRDFVLADKLRKELLDSGIILEDSKTGVRWKKA